MDPAGRLLEFQRLIERRAARSRSFHYCSFLVSIPLCLTLVASLRHACHGIRGSLMRRPSASDAAAPLAPARRSATLSREWRFFRTRERAGSTRRASLRCDVGNHSPATSVHTRNLNGASPVCSRCSTPPRRAFLNHHFDRRLSFLGHGPISTRLDLHCAPSILHELVYFHTITKGRSIPRSIAASNDIADLSLALYGPVLGNLTLRRTRRMSVPVAMHNNGGEQQSSLRAATADQS